MPSRSVAYAGYKGITVEKKVKMKKNWLSRGSTTDWFVRHKEIVGKLKDPVKRKKEQRAIKKIEDLDKKIEELDRKIEDLDKNKIQQREKLDKERSDKTKRLDELAAKMKENMKKMDDWSDRNLPKDGQPESVSIKKLDKKKLIEKIESVRKKNQLEIERLDRTIKQSKKENKEFREKQKLSASITASLRKIAADKQREAKQKAHLKMMERKKQKKIDAEKEKKREADDDDDDDVFRQMTDVVRQVLSKSPAMKLLGLDEGFTQSELKKKYRILAKKYHPDKGGDPVKFRRIHEAYKKLLKK